MNKQDIIDFMYHFTDKDDIKLVIVENDKEKQLDVDFLVINTHKIYLKEKTI